MSASRRSKAPSCCRQVDAAERQPDIVDDAARSARREWWRIAASTCVAQARRSPRCASGARANVQLDLAAVDRWEKILTEPGSGHQRKGQQRRRGHRGQEDRGKTHAAAQCRAQQIVIVPRGTVRSRSKPLRESADAGQAAGPGESCDLSQILRERRNQRSRQQVGGQHGEHHRLGERNEQKFGDSAEQEHRHEDDADRTAWPPVREARSAGAVQNSRLHGAALLQVEVDVLDGTVASSTRMPTASASPPKS